MKFVLWFGMNCIVFETTVVVNKFLLAIIHYYLIHINLFVPKLKFLLLQLLYILYIFIVGYYVFVVLRQTVDTSKSRCDKHQTDEQLTDKPQIRQTLACSIGNKQQVRQTLEIIYFFFTNDPYFQGSNATKCQGFLLLMNSAFAPSLQVNQHNFSYFRFKKKT